MYCDYSPVLVKAYQLLDEFIGKLIKVHEPEISIFISDHGQQNFKELCKSDDEEIRREAFASSNDVIWLPNGYIAFEAHNGALLLSAHSLYGTFIASGKGIKHTEINGMRTVDFYPTLLEMLNIEIPEGREGFVADIFDKPIVNKDKVLKFEKETVKKIAIVQTLHPGQTDIVINEIYIANRFSEITLVGEEKFREVFLNNPRISSFISYSDFDFSIFDEVYCGFYDDIKKKLGCVKIKG
jgi:hypothetical protein